MEYPLFNAKQLTNWDVFHALAWAASILADNVENVVDKIQKKNHTIDLEDVLNLMPQTSSLLSKLLRNLAPVTLDFIDMTVKIPLHFVSSITLIYVLYIIYIL